MESGKTVYLQQFVEQQSKGGCTLDCVLSLRFGNPKAVGQGEREEREREQGTQCNSCENRKKSNLVRK